MVTVQVGSDRARRQFVRTGRAWPGREAKAQRGEPLAALARPLGDGDTGDTGDSCDRNIACWPQNRGSRSQASQLSPLSPSPSLRFALPGRNVIIHAGPDQACLARDMPQVSPICPRTSSGRSLCPVPITGMQSWRTGPEGYPFNARNWAMIAS